MIRPTYNNCSQLPLYNFIQVLVHDDKSWLYSRPNKPWYRQADLNALWDRIFIEYIDKSSDKRSISILELMKEIQFINNKLNIIQMSVKLLSSVPDVTPYKETINILKSYGFIFRFTNETIIKDLEMTVNSAKILIVQREELQAQLKEINKNENQKANETDFYVHLANLSENQGFAIDPKTTTVLQYIGYLKVMEAKISAHESRANKGYS